MSDQREALPPAEEDGQPLAGSVKPHKQHLAVCTGGPPELWAARVEEMEGLFSALHAVLVEHRLHKQAKLTACDEPEYTNLQVAVREDGRVAGVVATARVPGPPHPVRVRAEFTLSCPMVWWTADEEPFFTTEL